MRAITKGKPPPLLAGYAQQHPGDWSALTEKDKQTLREGLFAEQRGLCAYCMGRLKLGEVRPSVKIEHVIPQAEAESVFEWRNLVLCCTGFEGRPWREQTCDTRKGNTRLVALNVLAPQGIGYGPAQGTVTSTVPDVRHDLNETLNLNSELLRTNRKNAVLGLAQALARRVNNQRRWPRAPLARYLENAQARPTLDAYFGILEYYLERKLAQSG